MNLTEHFLYEEFIASATAERLGIDNTPPAAVRVNLKRLAETLELVRMAVDNRPVMVVSGYRSVELNRVVNGSKTSAHMDGRAADIRVAGMRAFDVARAVRAADMVLDQLIYEGGRVPWVHVGIARTGDHPRGDVLTARFVEGRAVYGRGLTA